VLGTESPHGPIITVEDDGRGLDLAELAERAAAIGKHVPAHSIQELAFIPGLSTLSRPGELAGRGVGLPAVRSELATANYQVEVSSKAGEYARFVLKPKSATAGAGLYSEAGRADA